MAKQLAKKQSKTTYSEDKVSKKRAMKTLAIVLLVILGIAAIFALLKIFIPDLLGGASTSGKLAAKVNGEEITMQILNQGYDRLPMQYRMFLTKENYLEQMIDQILLKQEAVSKGIMITDEEADSNIKLFLSKNNISDEELNKILENQSLDYQSLVKVSKDQLAVQKLLKDELSNKINVTTEQIINYYNQNSETFRNPEIMTIRHILIGTLMQNRTAEDAEKTAKEILSKIKPDHSNFCDLVSQFSEDQRSIERCGEYQFPKGQLPEEFENWTKTAKDDDIGVVSTIYGFHVIWLINKTPEEIIPFKDVQDQIKLSLEQQEERLVYQDYLNGLRNKSDIKNYLTKNATIEQKTTPVPPVLEETLENETSTIDTTVTESTSIPSEETKETPLEEQTETNTQVTIQPDSVFLDCLNTKKATLYGASWNKDTTRQKALLGENIASLKYVECSVKGDYKTQTKECKDAKIDAYPTWVIGAKQYMGVYSLVQLADMVGCK